MAQGIMLFLPGGRSLGLEQQFRTLEPYNNRLHDDVRISLCMETHRQRRTCIQLPAKQDLRAQWKRSCSPYRTLSSSHFKHRVMERVFNHIRHMDVNDMYHDFNVCASFFFGADGEFGVLDEASLDFTGGRRARKARSSCWTSSTIALPNSKACLALEAASASQACEDIAAYRSSRCTISSPSRSSACFRAKNLQASSKFS